MIRLEHLTYRYGRNPFEAVSDATADITPGIHLLVGENGAGKTTLMQLMSGMLQPVSGECLLDGANVSLRRPSTLGRMFFLPEDIDCPFASVNEMARVHGCMYPDFNFELLQANLDDFGLTGDERLKSLSLGMRRKSFVAYALAMCVDVLMLDEPTNGMDIDSKKTLRRLINRCAGDDRTIIVSTHHVHDLGMLFDSVMLMRRGRLCLVMPVWQILEKVAFVSSPAPVEGAIYQEPEMGRYKAIVPNEDGIDTDIDYPLFYSAAMAPVGDMFIDFLTRYNPARNED